MLDCTAILCQDFFASHECVHTFGSSCFCKVIHANRFQLLWCNYVSCKIGTSCKHFSCMWVHVNIIHTKGSSCPARRLHYQYQRRNVEGNCVMRAPLLPLRSCQSVSLGSITPTRSPLFPIHRGINALYWPSHINYHLVPPHTDSVPPSTNHCYPILLIQYIDSSPRNAELNKLDLV